MNSPAHIAVALAALGRDDDIRARLWLIAGALAPDSIMFVFYGYHKLVQTPEAQIWQVEYFRSGWQNAIDLFNSAPLMLALLLVSLHFGWRLVSLCAGAMLLHVLLDLPLHNDDAHRHFYPFSDWQFISPVSYWDPAHYGNIMIWVEIVLVMLCCTALLVANRGKTTVGLVAGLIGVYGGFFVFAAIAWSGL